MVTEKNNNMLNKENQISLANKEGKIDLFIHHLLSPTGEELKKLFADFLEQNPNPVFCVDNDGTVLYGNRTSKELFQNGCCPQVNFIADSIADVNDADVDNKVELAFGERLYAFTFVPTAENKVVFFYGNDITEYREAEERLKKIQQSLAKAQEIARMGNWDWDIGNNNLTWSNEIYRIFGLKPQEFMATYEDFLNRVHPEDRLGVKMSFNKALYENTSYNMMYRIVLPGGEVRFVNEQGEAFVNEQGKPIRMVGTVQDITEIKHVEAQLKKLSKVIEKSINIVFITDYDGAIEYVNGTFEKITGYPREEVIGENPRILASGETKLEDYKAMWDDIKSGKTWRGLLKNRKKDGSFYRANGFISPIKNEQGEVTHFMAIQEDITDKVAADERLRYLSDYDTVTGIMNRVRFIEAFDKYLANAEKMRKNVVLMQINIDGFKLINASFGYSVGDKFLKSFSGFLTDRVKELDRNYGPEIESIVGRLSGDEFAVAFFSRKEQEGIYAAEVIRQATESHSFLNSTIRTTVSIGITLYPDHGTSRRDLLTHANAATVYAKEMGQNRYSLYSKGDDYLKQAQSSIEEKRRIITALEEDRIGPWVQPILHLHSGEIHHYEALARIHAPDGTVLPPSLFISTAERYGLISGIDRIITKKTMKIQAELKQANKKVSFSMNISGKHLGDSAMLFYLKNAIRESGADPDCLVFEITETAAIHNMNKAIDFVKALKKMGCKISLDDFGVGFTSFVHLIEMDIDFLKIDGSFVRHLPESERNRVLVKTIADMAKRMGIETVAEFVDREEILPILRESGVDYAQGYLIGKPSPSLKS